jgi:hypothetical protein
MLTTTILLGLLSSHLLQKLKINIKKAVILPVVLYGCETWSLVVREEDRMRVSEKRILGRIFGTEREEVVGGWRRLHNEELHNLYASPNTIRVIKSRRMIWAGHVALLGGMRNAYKILVGKSEQKRPLGRPRRRWEHNITMDLRESEWEDVVWIYVTEHRN